MIRLGRELRRRGVAVGPGEIATAVRALDAVEATDARDARLAARAVLCRRHEDLPAFELAWHEIFGRDLPDPGEPVDLGEGATFALPRVANPDWAVVRVPQEVEVDVVPSAYSQEEILRDRDFAEYTDAERHAAHEILRRLARYGPTRRGRRTRPARHLDHGPVDLRGTLRHALRTGGEPVRRARRGRVTVPRPLVLVVDVSGSMAPYARMLLMYAQAAVTARRRVEAFVFGTRLTRVTLELRGRDSDRALDRAARAVEDWSGGTRIGAAIGELNRVHGRRLGRGAVVVILSDGWDTGEPEVLAAEMARLRRSAHRVIWLNPLKAAPGYEPLARGMAAALPYTDHFLPGNTLRGLEDLAALLEGGMT